ncbi:hypothetical protein ES288_A02G200900v1 [Gossypium darwinii]|uniref:Uncharacterized protein n=1 Tax=Gossypium darwinii TaxID=34276 RepID=A0A5D2HG18_GOSDA|nr:hypothetical protein ES288_A02G200900v1 [Gossypium darwinii]
MYPFDVVPTRFQVYDGPVNNCPTYKNTAHAIFTITRLEDCTLSLSLSLFFLCIAKQRYFRNREEKLSPILHLASAAEAGALVSICTNPIWLIRTRLELQSPLHQSQPYSGVYDDSTLPNRNDFPSFFSPGISFTETGSPVHLMSFCVAANPEILTMLREEGWTALYTRLGPGLLMQVSHGAIQFTAYEELRRIMVDYEERKKKPKGASNLLVIDVKNSFDYAVLGGSSKIAAILVTYPFQQQPSNEGIPRYTNSWHVVKETAWFEGFHRFYKGINPNLLRHVPASSITFIVCENVLKFLKSTKSNYW